MNFFFPFLLFLPLLLQFVSPQEIYIMCEREGEIAFTYDQGPSPYTGKLLATLAKLKAKATFHVSPDYLDNPVILAYLRKAALDGHLIGIFVKDSVSKASVKSYLATASATIKRFTNMSPTFLRFTAPGPDPEMLKTVIALGYTVTSYNLDSLDYNAINEATPQNGRGSVFATFKTIFDQILPPAKGSFIAIQRDIVQSSIDQSEEIIKYALEKGYRPVTLDQCINKKSTPDSKEPPSSSNPVPVPTPSPSADPPVKEEGEQVTEESNNSTSEQSSVASVAVPSLLSFLVLVSLLSALISL